MLCSLQDGEAVYGNTLKGDREATMESRKEAVSSFFQENVRTQGTDQRLLINTLFAQHQDPKQIEMFIQDQMGTAPDLVSIQVQKPSGPNTYFVDYFCLRQGLGRLIKKGSTSSFNLIDVEEAIDQIGITVVELDPNWGSESAYLRRTFCIFEAFLTCKHKRKLLVCGSAVKDPKDALALAKMAADHEQQQIIVDSSNANCRSASDKQKIDSFIIDSVGFRKLHCVVLASIVDGCVANAHATEVISESEYTDGAAAIMYSMSGMLLAVEEHEQALQQATRAFWLRAKTHL
jgi:hypothetical protein